MNRRVVKSFVAVLISAIASLTSAAETCKVLLEPVPQGAFSSRLADSPAVILREMYRRAFEAHKSGRSFSDFELNEEIPTIGIIVQDLLKRRVELLGSNRKAAGFQVSLEALEKVLARAKKVLQQGKLVYHEYLTLGAAYSFAISAGGADGALKMLSNGPRIGSQLYPTDGFILFTFRELSAEVDLLGYGFPIHPVGLVKQPTFADRGLMEPWVFAEHDGSHAQGMRQSAQSVWFDFSSFGSPDPERFGQLIDNQEKIVRAWKTLVREAPPELQRAIGLTGFYMFHEVGFGKSLAAFAAFSPDDFKRGMQGRNIVDVARSLAIRAVEQPLPPPTDQQFAKAIHYLMERWGAGGGH